MTIQIGDHLPQAILKKITPNGTLDVNTEALFKGKTVALFAIPGAFTPICTTVHLPGFSNKMDQFKAKGIEVMCLSVNDPFVMAAWGKATNSHPDIALLADWDAHFTKEIGLTLDASGAALGLRSLRYSMLIKDGVIMALNVENSPSLCDVSSADSILKAL
jgi:peroxiredoxin